jgi:hypothetical protein
MSFDPAWADKISQKQGSNMVAFDSEHWVSLEQVDLFNEKVLECIESSEN